MKLSEGELERFARLVVELESQFTPSLSGSPDRFSRPTSVAALMEARRARLGGVPG
jgi:hypothetical protein